MVGEGEHREGDRLENGRKREDRWWGRGSTEKEIDWEWEEKRRSVVGEGEHRQEDRLGNGERREDRWWGRGSTEKR